MVGNMMHEISTVIAAYTGTFSLI